MSLSPSVGDMLLPYQRQSLMVKVKSDVNQHVLELGSGQAEDVSQHLSGHFATLSQLSHGLKLAEAYQGAITRTTLMSEAMQVSLEHIQTGVEDFTPHAELSAETEMTISIDLIAQEASVRLEDALLTLNTRVDDITLFAGVRSDGLAVGTAEDLFRELDAITADLTTAEDIERAIRGWFSDPDHGFDATLYQGGDARPPVKIAADRTMPADITANDGAIKEILAGYSVAAYAQRIQGLPSDEQVTLVRRSGEMQRDALDGIVELRAGLGLHQARLEETRTANAAERTALAIARSDVIAVDPYESAMSLESAQTHLEMLYSLTSRLSQMSLMDYLR